MKEDSEIGDTRSYPRRRLVLMLFLVCLLNFADRAIFAVLAQVIKVDLGLSDLQLGLSQGTAFALLYAACGLPIGLLAERIPRKWIIAAVTALWSVATVGTGAVTNFSQLLAARLVVGMGEAGFTPCAISMVADVARRDRRASMVALVMLGTPVGTLVGAILAGIITASWTWRAAFLAFGLPGLIMAGLFVCLVPEPEREAGALSVGMPPLRHLLGSMVRNRALRWVIFGGSLAAFGATSIAQFMGVFLLRTYHLGVSEGAALYGGISCVSIAVGLLAGSVGSDYLARHDPRWPAWSAALGLGCAPPLYWFAFHAHALPQAIILLTVSGALLMSFYGPTAALMQNLLPARMRASGFAVYILLYTLVGAGLGPFFIGAVSDLVAGRAYAGSYSIDCPHGLPPTRATPDQVTACLAASTTGIQMALSLAALSLVLAAACFLAAASGLKHQSEGRPIA